MRSVLSFNVPPIKAPQMDKHGLTSHDLETIFTIFGQYPEQVVDFWLIGSRARGDHRRGSDVDFIVQTVGDLKDVGYKLRSDFEESNFAYFVDVTVLHPNLDPNFAKCANRDKVQLSGNWAGPSPQPWERPA